MKSKLLTATLIAAMLVPATAIVLAVVAFNLIGDGVAARARSRSRAVE